MKRTVCLVLMVLAALSASAGGQKDARWISDAYDGLDPQKYIAASASGASYDDADKKAMSAVAAVLMQDIDAEEYVSQSATSDGMDLSTYLADIRTASSIKDISGLSVHDRLRSGGTYYARAVLDKAAASAYYSVRLSKNAMEIETLAAGAAAEPGTIAACADMLKAYRLAKTNDEYVGLLSVIKPAARHQLSYGSSAEIAAAVRKAFSAVTVYIDAGNAQVAAAAAETLNGFGICTASAPSGGVPSAGYTFRAELSLEDVEKSPSSDIYFTRCILSCALSDNASGRDIVTLSTNSRQGKLSRQEARQSAVRAAETAVRQEFAAKFSALFDGAS
ncbi:MAG: hypothetical protein K2H09_01080 [Treponemataceae bacterium]|nr:hypothetical protein [Treponemataceae bacterium]